MAELMEADLSEMETAVLMIDGLNAAGEMIVVALVICADGAKVPVGLRLGDTENGTVVKDLLAEMVERGLRYEHGILAVLDGSKALHKAVVKVFGERALMQRCTLHKRRNCIDYLPRQRHQAIDRRLAKIFANPDPDAAIAEVKRLAATLRTDDPDAAASLLEGLDEMFTVTRLGIGGSLHRSLTNTNCIESMISTVRVLTGRVKTWRDGDMKKRCIATGMIEAQRSCRRVRGCTQMPDLVAALSRATNSGAPDNYDRAVA